MKHIIKTVLLISLLSLILGCPNLNEQLDNEGP